MIRGQGPTFLGLGAQKAATTWLHDALATHPEIFVSDPKELDFFTHCYNRGYAWYERHFAEARAAARGETSPSYLYDPAAPARVRAYRPRMRLIALLRDPVARAYSNHLHEIRVGHLVETTVFEEAEPLNPLYLEQGLYAAHLRRWLEVFDREQLLILLAEEVAADPAGALDRVYAHIGVAPGFRPPRYEERRHENVAPKLAGLQRGLRAGGDALRAAGLGETLESVKRWPPVARLLRLNQVDLRRATPPMTEATRRRLAAFFAEDMRALAAMMGRDRLPWPSFPEEAAA